MARTISKNVTTSTIFAFNPDKPYELDSNDMPLPNVTFDKNGNVTLERAQRLAETFCKSKNVMAMYVETSVRKSVVSPEKFFMESEVCKDGVSYGHDCIVQEFVFTVGDGFAITKNGMVKLNWRENPEIMYFGKTTTSKYINFLREVLDTKSVTVTKLHHAKVKQWMSKEKYEEISRVVDDEPTDN